MKRVSFVTAIVLATVAVLFILWQLQSVALTFLFSLALAAAMTGPVNFFFTRGWSRGWAVITSFLAVLLGLILFLVLVTLPLLSEIDPLMRNLILEYHRIQAALLRVSGSQPTLATRLPSTEQLAAWWSGGEVEVLLRNFAGITQSVGALLGQFLLGVVISVYWMLDQLRFERLWLSLLPPASRTRARDTWHAVEHDVGSYLRSEFLQFVLAALLLAPGFWLMEVKQPIILALFVALVWLLPLIGPIFAVPTTALIGWLTGMDVAVGAAVYTIVILAFLEFYVEPRLYRHERYWNVLVVLMMLILGDALGLVGLLLAPPISVAIQVVLNRLLAVEAAAPTPVPATTPVLEPEFSALLRRLEELRMQLQPGQEGGSHRVNNLYSRLDQLLHEVREQISPGATTRKIYEPEHTANLGMGFAKNHSA